MRTKHLTFEGTIQGVNLYDSSMIRSSVRLVGHMEYVACTITIETSRDIVQEIEARYAIDAGNVHMQIGNGEEL